MIRNQDNYTDKSPNLAIDKYQALFSDHLNKTRQKSWQFSAEKYKQFIKNWRK